MKQSVSKELLNDIRLKGTELYQLLDDTNGWVDQNLKNEEKAEVAKKLKDLRRITRKIVRSVESKPVFALFGASQVGKSYLVKNILSLPEKSLEIELNHETYDFLKDINPPGTGAESTGVVTRFSISENPSENFPIKIQLLDIKDIILILCDSYFSDLKKLNSYPNTLKFSEKAKFINELINSKTEIQQFFTEDDVWDIRSYFNNSFPRFHYYTSCIEESEFWFALGAAASRLQIQDLPKVVAILWDNNPCVTDLFVRLLEGLESIHFERVVFAKTESILRSGHAILDVQRLKEIFSNEKTLEISTSSQQIKSIPSALLSALSAELTLPVSKALAEYKPFLINTDLLDFPGARSRLDLEQESITEESVPDMLLRGKIAYLFNKYSADFEINNLLFCTNDKQLDVNEIPTLLNDWICNNVGFNLSDRQERIAASGVDPLFIIFTFFNRQLAYDSTNDDTDVTYKWNNRFTRFFEHEIVSNNYHWHKNWTTHQPLFKNFYLLRDYKFSTDTFLGYEETGLEQEIAPQRLEYLNVLKDSFLNYPFVQEHFHAPLAQWDAAASKNQDGSEYIIKNLEPAAHNITKTKNYLGILNGSKTEYLGIMKKFWHSSDVGEKRKIAFRKGQDLQLNLNRVFGHSSDLFSEFLSLLLLDESQVYQLFHNNLLESRVTDSYDKYTFFKSQFPRLSNENTYDQNLEILKEELHMLSNEEVENYLAEQGYDLRLAYENKFNTSAKALIQKLIEHWKLLFDEARYEKYFELGLSRNMLSLYLDTLLETFENLEIKDLLVKLVEQKTKRLQLGREAEEYLASVTTHIINDFVTNFGFSNYEASNLKEIQQICADMKIDTEPLNEVMKEDMETSIESLFQSNSSTVTEFNPVIQNYNKYLLKIKMALVANCGTVNYDVLENEKLAHFIRKMETLEIKNL